jgi:hypothetical protein
MGVMLSRHKDETFQVEIDEELLTLELQQARKRVVSGQEARVCYCFRQLAHEKGDR